MKSGCRQVQIFHTPAEYDQYYTSSESNHDAWLVTDGDVDGHGATLKAASKSYEGEVADKVRTAYYVEQERQKAEYEAKQAAAIAKRKATLAAKKAGSK